MPFAVQGVQWQPYSANSRDLVAALDFLFVTDDLIVDVTPAGAYGTRGNRIADGVYIENIENSFSITIQIGTFRIVVPPFTSQKVSLSRQYPSVKIISNGPQSLRVQFYTGNWPGPEFIQNQLGATVVAQRFAQTGQIVIWGGLRSTIPSDVILCDGQSLPISSYPNLAPILIPVYGYGDPPFNIEFLVPNINRFGQRIAPNPFLRGSTVLVGASRDNVGPGDYDSITGQRIGANFRTLTQGNIAPHSHGVTDPGHFHAPTYLSAGLGVTVNPGLFRRVDTVELDSNTTEIFTTINTTGLTVNNNVGGDPFDNRPSSLPVAYVIGI